MRPFSWLHGAAARQPRDWYESERGSKGLEVAELWLTADEIPASLRDGLARRLEEHWANIDRPLPSWLDKVTLALHGEARREALRRDREQRVRSREEAAAERRWQEAAAAAERRRREEEARQRAAAEEQARRQVAREAEEQRQREQLQGRAEEIRRFCDQRRITTLVHFTRVYNLQSILLEGLQNRQALDARQWQNPPQYNDPHRLDGHPNAICLSTSFPNYSMFYKYSSQSRAQWAVLLLASSILWELDCAFCHENAASRAVTAKPIPMRKQAAALARLFADYPGTPRQCLGIPDNYPTHPQAEVLVFDPIPPRYIEAVHFHNRAAVPAWLFGGQASFQQQFFCANQFFVPRQDWEAWRPAQYAAYDDPLAEMMPPPARAPVFYDPFEDV